MSRKTILIAAGALLAVGGVAVAIAQVGQRDSRFGDRMMRGEWGHGPMMRGDRGWHGRMDRHGFLRGRDRSVTQDEFDARTRERFARLDKNSDSVIEAAEIEAMLSDRGARRGRMGEHLQQRVMARWDADRDGKATKDELLANARKRFAEFDLNSDGKITDDDLPPIMRGRNVLKGDDGTGGGFGGLRPRRGGGMLGELRQADADKDGAVTLDEALAHATKRFETFDTSKDGSIEPADFDAARKEMIAYRTQRFIHRFGADKDGRITREQFDKVAKQRFAERDLNNDGKLDRDDFSPGMHGRRHMR
jgi:Ca2+-binding EF-hand superfamily protein